MCEVLGHGKERRTKATLRLQSQEKRTEGEMSREERSALLVEADVEEDFDPKPNARLKVELHVLQKGFQAGSILGTVLAVPVSLYKTRGINLRTVLVYSGRGGIIGEVLIGLLGWYRISTIKEQEAMEDRNYRLHYNEGQQRCDRFANIAAAVGAAGFGAQSAFGSSPGNNFFHVQLATPSVSSASRVVVFLVGLGSALLGGAALGTLSGVILHVATYSVPEDQRLPNRMIKEIRD